MNLRNEAKARGVDPGRIIFAPRCDYLEHMTRHCQADLFLDTFPYNAHATASDALWAGLPVLTVAGRSFASRVGASLLMSLGLPQLITENFEDYENVARKLASDRHLMESVRGDLEAAKSSSSLFDCAAFTRNLEQAYHTIWTRWREGKAPAPFDVEERS